MEENQINNNQTELIKSCCGDKIKYSSCRKAGILIVGLLLTVSLFYAGYQFSKISEKPTVVYQPTPTSIVQPSPTPTPDPTANWKTYTNTKYKYQLNYPSTAEIIIPNLEDRQLIENGKLNIENLKDIQFREETPYSFWFVASISGNEKNLSLEQFVDVWIEMGKKNPGNSFNYTDRSNMSLSAGKAVHVTTYKWYASGINQNVLVKTIFYPLKGNILILSFSGYNTDNKTETVTIENKISQIINSLKDIN